MPALPTHLLIIAAMDEEESALLSALGTATFELKVISPRLGISLKEAQIGFKTVMIARSGMGTVNAALTVALIAERWRVDAVLLLGVGGALTEDLAIGDVVISRQVMQHDYFSSLDFGHPRMLPGQVIFNFEEARAHRALIDADPDLVAWVERNMSEQGARTGTLLSGNEFVGTLERKKAIAALHGEALMVDMEAAGVAQVCQKLALPFVVIKTVADRLHADGSIESDFRASLTASAKNASLVLRGLLRATLSMDELYSQTQKGLNPDELILDVRDTDDYVEGHVAGSRSIPVDQVLEHVTELTAYQRVYVHCGGGGKAGRAVASLEKAGLSNLVHIADSGMRSWIASGFSVVKGH
jgi:adenosylhomocysteine nucleosidase